jgi:hypothetical protein
MPDDAPGNGTEGGAREGFRSEQLSLGGDNERNETENNYFFHNEL